MFQCQCGRTLAFSPNMNNCTTDSAHEATQTATYSANVHADLLPAAKIGLLARIVCCIAMSLSIHGSQIARFGDLSSKELGPNAFSCSCKMNMATTRKHILATSM
eukprot:821602-Amphidinium_carterae.1